MSNALQSIDDPRTSRPMRALVVALVIAFGVLGLAPAVAAESGTHDCGPADAAGVDFWGGITLTDARVNIATDDSGTVTAQTTTGYAYGVKVAGLTLGKADGYYATLVLFSDSDGVYAWALAPHHKLSFDGCTIEIEDARTLIVIIDFFTYVDTLSAWATDAV